MEPILMDNLNYIKILTNPCYVYSKNSTQLISLSPGATSIVTNEETILYSLWVRSALVMT